MRFRLGLSFIRNKPSTRMLVFQQESGLPAADVILGLGCRGLNGRGKSWERKPDEWSTR